MVKKAVIQIRLDEEEKAIIEAEATKQGFNSVTAFILWLFRKYGKKV